MIQYLSGDATNPNLTNDNVVICHICNNIGAWGKGFVLALNENYPNAKKEYLEWHANPGDIPFKLGNMQIVDVSNNIYIANMICQKGIRDNTSSLPPIRYLAVESCFEKLSIWADDNNADIHMPRIGCGLAGGSWDNIEKLINFKLSKHNVYVYDYVVKKI